MMRRLSAVLALAVLSSPLSAQPAPIPGQIPVGDLVNGTVFIDVIDGSGHSRNDPGSGVLLSPNGFILTARHIIEPNLKEANDQIVVALKSAHGQRLPAHLFGCTTGKFDACLLYVPSLDIAASGISASFRLSCRMPRAAEPIVIAGYTAEDGPFVVLSGLVSSVDFGHLEKMYMDARVLPGMSGGPVLDRNGALVGIVYGYGQNVPLGMFTPLLEAANLLALTGIPCLNDVAAVAVSSKSLPPVAHVDPNSASILSSALSGTIPGEPPLRPPSLDLPSVRLPTKVFIQIASSSQYSFALNAIERLKASAITVSDGVENVGIRSPNSPQVRYFRDEDKGAASVVKGAIDPSGTAFQLDKVEVQTPPPGLVEVWYPRCDKTGPFCESVSSTISSSSVYVESGGTTDNRSDQCKDHSAPVCVKPTIATMKLIPGTAKLVIAERSGAVFIDGNPQNSNPVATSNIGWYLRPDKNSPDEICAFLYARTSACETKVYIRGQLTAQEIESH